MKNNPNPENSQEKEEKKCECKKWPPGVSISCSCGRFSLYTPQPESEDHTAFVQIPRTEEEQAKHEKWTYNAPTTLEEWAEYRIHAPFITRLSVREIDVLLEAQAEQIRREERERYAALIGEAYLIDKKFDPTAEDLSSMKGDLVLAFPKDTPEIVSLWCAGQKK